MGKVEVPKELQHLIEQSKCWSHEAFVLVAENCFGIEINNMTLRHLMMLDGVETPFLKGGTITDADIALFLWIVSKDYCLDEKVKKN